MTSRRNKPTSAKSHGEIRQSQVVTTFGPGAPLDLPNYSVLVGGLDSWVGGEEIIEERLTEKLQRLLDKDTLKLRCPPQKKDDPESPNTGITVWRFPEWFITQNVRQDPNHSTRRSRYLVHRTVLQGGKFVDEDRKPQKVVPIRFVRACPRGHIGDIDWHAFVHQGINQCKRQLHMEERGTSGDLSEVWIHCECKAQRRVIEATHLDQRPLDTCDGNRPWLGPYSTEKCNLPNRLLVRSASHAYFPQLMSVISIPSHNQAIIEAVNQVWEHYLEYVTSIEELQLERDRKPPVREALSDFNNKEIFEVIQERLRGGSEVAKNKTVKEMEVETLITSREELGEDRPDGDFYARALPHSQWNRPVMDSVQHVVLVHRLREVVAQVGFTRFESTSPDIEGELEIGVERAELSRQQDWLPAIENKGEGIFLAFKAEAINDWLVRPAVTERARQLLQGFENWKKEHPMSKREFFGAPYIMLHSLSHLLITALSLECGYPASSIRERIYATQKGYGILLFTGAADAEGTLGGLIAEGRRIHNHLESALRLGTLCSYDPVCAQHDPSNKFEQRYFHGAACHGCLLIAEPSCEQRNDYLDRALVVPTIDNKEAAFFNRVQSF